MIKLISIIISILSLILSGVIGSFTYIQTKKHNEYEKEQDKQNEKTAKELRRWEKEVETYKIELQKINNRERITPYFNLVLDDKNITYRNGQLKMKIGLINTGINTATNISIPYYQKPERNEDGTFNFFGTSAWYGNIHTYSDYLSEIYAFPKDKVFLGITAHWEKLQERKDYVDYNPGHKIADVAFKVRFTDAMGRKYEQICKFIYEVKIENGKLVNGNFSLDRSVSAPQLLDE